MIPSRITLPSITLPSIALLVACHHTAAPVEPVSTDPAAALAAARHSRDAGLIPLTARFSLHLETGDKSVNASGAAVIRPPDHVRVEVSGPLGPPALVIAADGTAVSVWQAGKGLYHRSPDADAALRVLTGGAGGLDLLTGLLLGQYVEPAAPGSLTASPPVAAMMAGEPGWTWRWCDTSGTCLDETLSARGGHLVAVHAQAADGQSLFDASLVPNPGSPWPERLTVSLPTLAVTAELRFTSWAPFAAPDAAFVIAPPPGTTILPLNLGKPGADTGGTAPDAPATPPAPAPTP